MLAIDQRTLRITWTVFLFVAGVALIYAIRDALVTFTLAIFLALFISPIVTLVDRFTPARVPCTAALAMVYVLFIAITITVLVSLGSVVSEDAGALTQKLPASLQSDPLSRLPLPVWLEPARERITGALHDGLDQLGQNVLNFSGRAARELASGLGAAVSVVLIPIVAFFMINNARELRSYVIESFPVHRQFLVFEILSDLQRLLAQYLRALVILSAATFVAYSAFLGVTGAPYAILLGGFAAILEFIPAVGPFVAALAILVVTGVSGYGYWAILLGFLVVYRLLQDYVLQPLLLSSGVQVHPLLVIFGALAGGELAGIPGVFFSVPLIAALRVISARIRAPRVDPLETPSERPAA
jgi:predicted PurR-regulated permease PerM